MDQTAPTHPSGGIRAHQLLSTALRTTLSDLRDEITLHLTNANLDGHVPHLIHRVADQARADGLRAEQVVIAFGQLWDNLPGAGHAAASRRDEIRWNVVSALITAYYNDDTARPVGLT
jgi:hypothetical protein